MKAKELRLRDVVRYADDRMPAWGTMVVSQITADEVHFFRPYAITSDFAYTGGVIPYIGTETVKIALDDSRHDFDLLERPTKAK